MYTFASHSRSAWRKSVENAARCVATGKMTEEEFAAAPDSPHPHDPKPAALLAAARRNHAAAQAWEAGAAERAAKAAADRKATEVKIENLRHVRCWHLCGPFLDDLSADRYTLAEIAAWVDWDAYNLRAKYATIVAVAVSHEVQVDFSDRFIEVCGGRVPLEVNIATACRRLAEYVADLSRRRGPGDEPDAAGRVAESK